MAREPFSSLDDYELFLGETLERWSPMQRVALAAAMAERWLPAYDAFAKAEDWGDPAGFRRSLDAVWGHLGGRPLSSADVARHRALLRDSTPHMDDFDAPEALAACVILSEALQCCEREDNLPWALQATLSGFEAVAPDGDLDSDEQPRLWKKQAVRKELRKQLRLLDQIGALTEVTADAVAALRHAAMAPENVGEAPAKPKLAGPPPGLTNQAAFEQYRRMVESDLRSTAPADLGAGPVVAAILWFSTWAGRYRRRMDTINGTYGRLADAVAPRALVARARACDSGRFDEPDWDVEVRQMIDLCLANPHGGLDVRSLDQPHGYGPSLRRLWAQARNKGLTGETAWQEVLAWARHRPASWDTEDRRKGQGRGHAQPKLVPLLSRTVDWAAIDDPFSPWAAEVDGVRWRVRLNDFPDELMYTLIVGDTVVGDFHDWPETWRRPETGAP